MQSSRLRQSIYFTLLWTKNGGREIQPLYLSPTRCFKIKVFNYKTCIILLHIVLLFLHVKTLRKKLWFSFFQSIQCAPWLIEKIKKFKLNHLTCSIDRKWFSIDRKSWNSNFQNFSKVVFFVFHEQTFNIWTLQTKIDVKTDFYWCHSLKIQFNVLKFKFKQHHNINFSFHQIIVSTTCRKLKTQSSNNMKLSSLILKLTKHVKQIGNWRPLWYQLLEICMYAVEN